MPIVYSTLTCDTAYAQYAKNGSKDLPVIERSILIKGGANLMSRHFVTPRGVATEISDDDLKILMDDIHFKDHIDKGFITVEDHKADPDKVAKNLTSRDQSAPLTPDSPELKGKTEGSKKSKR